MMQFLLGAAICGFGRRRGPPVRYRWGRLQAWRETRQGVPTQAGSGRKTRRYQPVKYQKVGHDALMPPALRYPHLRRDLYTPGSRMDWGRALPSVVRLLADRQASVALPAAPMVRAGEDHDVTFNRALAYWTALGHLLRLRLGWTHPAQGLAHWLDEGDHAKLCEALALVRHVWLGDGVLPIFMAWRVQENNDHVPSSWTAKINHRQDLYLDQEGQPVGPWQLHLADPGGHVITPETAPPPQRAWLQPFHPEAGAHRSTAKGLLGPSEPVLLFRGSLESGWYGALQEAPTDEVRVVSEELGTVGRFRRSPASGRWHTTSEAIHLWGIR